MLPSGTLHNFKLLKWNQKLNALGSALICVRNHLSCHPPHTKATACSRLQSCMRQERSHMIWYVIYIKPLRYLFLFYLICFHIKRKNAVQDCRSTQSPRPPLTVFTRILRVINSLSAKFIPFVQVVFWWLLLSTPPEYYTSGISFVFVCPKKS